MNPSTKENNNNKVWTSGLENVACVPEVFDFREIIHLCANNFDSKIRTIVLLEKMIPLNLKAFRWIFKLPKPNMLLRLLESNSFSELEASEANNVGDFISQNCQSHFNLSFLDISLFNGLGTFIGFVCTLWVKKL